MKKKKNPTLERTHKMIMEDRKLRIKVFKVKSFYGSKALSIRVRKIAKKVYDGNQK